MMIRGLGKGLGYEGDHSEWPLADSVRETFVKAMNSEIASHVVSVLNRALKADPIAMYHLFSHRVPCNAALTMDETIQVRQEPTQDTVGILGLINGLLGVDERGYGPITAVVSDDDDNRIFEFRLTEPADPIDSVAGVGEREN